MREAVTFGYGAPKRARCRKRRIQPRGSLRTDCGFLYSEATLEEVVDVLARPRLRRRFPLRGRDPQTVIELILLRGEAVEPRRRWTVCRDPKDDKFLDVAVEGHADALVSGDEDLLVLHPFQGIPIVQPARFLAMFD